MTGSLVLILPLLFPSGLKTSKKSIFLKAGGSIQELTIIRIEQRWPVLLMRVKFICLYETDFGFKLFVGKGDEFQTLFGI